jgi:hypothetical protein
MVCLFLSLDVGAGAVGALVSALTYLLAQFGDGPNGAMVWGNLSDVDGTQSNTKEFSHWRRHRSTHPTTFPNT